MCGMNAPIQSRRAMLSGSAALLTGVTAFLATQDTAPNPDAELIALCAEIDALEDRMWGNLPKMSDEEEKQHDAEIEPLRQKQLALIDQISDLTATTLDGFRARARTIAKWAPDLIPMPHDYLDQMAGALIRDLIGETRV
jgi:hypothetical protein